MPTGYTAELCDKDVAFEKFVLLCARAFGACIEMKEDSLGVPIPEKFEPNDHHNQKLMKARRQLGALLEMSRQECDEAADLEYVESMKAYENHIAQVGACRNRLLGMRMKVADWVPPTPDHEGLKKFMIQQLDETLKYDGLTCLSVPKKKTGDLWRASKVEALEWDIEYHEKERRKEVESVEEKNRWIADLRASLKA